MHLIVETATASGEHGTVRRYPHALADVAGARKPTATRKIAGVSVPAPPSPPTVLWARGSQRTADDIARRDPTTEEPATATGVTTIQSIPSSGTGASAPEATAATSGPAPGFSETAETVMAATGMVRRAELLPETGTTVSGAQQGRVGTVASAPDAFTAHRTPATCPAVFSAGTAAAAAVAADAAAAGGKVVYVLPEQTPPAVRLVLGRRAGWTEWDVNLHGADEVIKITPRTHA